MSVTDGSVGELIDHVAARQPAPAGGAVTVLCATQVSPLLAMMTRCGDGTTGTVRVAVASTALWGSGSLQAHSLDLVHLDIAACKAVASLDPQMSPTNRRAFKQRA
jgi:formiminotetrahydrofolate cyclodeaminase